jgi:hypothetical protein
LWSDLEFVFSTSQLCDCATSNDQQATHNHRNHNSSSSLPNTNTMADANQNGSDQDEAPKQRARDLNMDELERAPNLTGGGASKNWIWALIGVLVIAGGVTAGVVLSRDKDPSPTPQPMSSPTSYIASVLPEYSIEIAENDPTSPQARALDWLQDDPRHNEYELYRLLQRYALAVLYYSTNGDSWENRTGWLSSDNECEWYNDDQELCDESFRLHTLRLSANGLDGTIPAELELITDLTQMMLIGNLLREIPSAMYVSWRPGGLIWPFYLSRFKFTRFLRQC